MGYSIDPISADCYEGKLKLSIFNLHITRHFLYQLRTENCVNIAYQRFKSDSLSA